MTRDARLVRAHRRLTRALALLEQTHLETNPASQAQFLVAARLRRYVHEFETSAHENLVEERAECAQLDAWLQQHRVEPCAKLKSAEAK